LCTYVTNNNTDIDSLLTAALNKSSSTIDFWRIPLKYFCINSILWNK
jgi:hypothetical protein